MLTIPSDGHPIRSILILLATAGSVFAQGSLTPPGAPAPTMKTLQQVEPRRDVLTLSGDSGSSYVISVPGSYYLTTNILGTAAKNGIRIATNNVILDLNGFALIGTNGSSAGIEIGTVPYLSIYNGTIRGWGGAGIHAGGAGSAGCRFEKLLVASNGAGGLNLGSAATVVDCVANLNIGNGILTLTQCAVKGCATLSNSISGIDVGAASIVSGCLANGNLAQGIYPDNNCTMRDCTAEYNSGNGILADTFSDCLITGCLASNNATNGIVLGAQCVAQGNTCNNNAANGIYATGNFNRIEGNHAMNNIGFGIQVLANQYNVVIRNSAGSLGVTPGFSIPGGNVWGPIISMNSGVLATPATGSENFEYHLSL